MKEATLCIIELQLPTARETMNALRVNYKTAKCINAELSDVVRNMRKGVKLFWNTQDHTFHYAKACGRLIDERLVNYIDDLFGLTWSEICQFEIGALLAA